MTTVWVVKRSVGFHTEVESIFSSKKQAEKYLEGPKLLDKLTNSSNKSYIEEVELNPSPDYTVNDIVFYWKADIDITGDFEIKEKFTTKTNLPKDVVTKGFYVGRQKMWVTSTISPEHCEVQAKIMYADYLDYLNKV
jgi:hypothetical protein